MSRTFAASATRRFLALGLIPLVVVGLFAGIEIAHIQREAANYRARLLAQSIESQVEAFLSQPIISLAQLGHLSEDTGTEQLLVHNLADHMPSVESVYLVDSHGIVRAAGQAPGMAGNPADFHGTDRSRDPLYQTALRTQQPAWSGVFTSSVSGRRVLGLAVPYEGGMAMADVQIQSLSDSLRKVSLDPGTSVVIADRNGNVLFHSDDAIAKLRPNWLTLRPISEGAQGRAGDYVYALDGKTMLGSTQLVENADWTVLVQQQQAVAMLPVVAVWAGFTAVVILVAVAAIVGAMLFSRNLSRPIGAIEQVAASIEHGDYTKDVPRFEILELQNLAHSIESMAKAVRDREAALFENQTFLVEESEAKSRALEHLSAMSAELSAAEERERRRLAEELHDRVSQVLAVARMRLGMIREGMDTSPENVQSVDTLIGEAVVQTREITTELAPPVLYEIGLGAAITDLGIKMGKKHGIEVHVAIDEQAECLTDEAKMAMFRAARELIMNVIKHAGTGEAWVSLERAADQVTLTVRDKGVGIARSAGSSEGGFGLFSIRERLLHLDGSVEITSDSGKGTLATVSIPSNCDE